MKTTDFLKRLTKAHTTTPEDNAREQVRRLASKLSKREGKYIRSLNRYNNNGVRRDSLWDPNTFAQGYAVTAQNTDGVQTQFNLIKSCVDAITSKISDATVRPFFNSLNGDYDTDCVCKSIQHHFDFWLDEQHAYPKSVLCFRDAAIFDMGVMQIDSEGQSIDRVPPWEYFIDPAEYMHHAVTQALRWRKFYPLAALMGRIEKEDLKKLIADDPHATGEYAEYYDLIAGLKWEFYDHYLVREPQKLDYEKYGGFYRRPFVEIFYTKPVKGFFTTSLADDLYPIQRQVDELIRRFDNATRNMPLAMAFVPKGSGLKASQLNNAVTAYDVLTGGESGQVTFVTPAPLSQEWLQLLNMYIAKAYELMGISELSAQSKKPADVESGKALETLESVESDRFNVQLQQFTHFLVDVSRVVIDVFPTGKTILPPKILRDDVTWGEARKQRDKYSIQFSAASVLSKDPDKKMQQVQTMINGGFIDQSMASHFLQVPDLEGVYTIQSANYDAIQKIIKEVIEGSDQRFWETVDLQQLKSEVVKRINMLLVSEDDDKYVARLAEFLVKVNDEQKAVLAVNKPQPPQLPPEPLKDKSMDSGQITGLMAILDKVNQGMMTPEQASSLVANAYPEIGKDSIAMLVKPAPVAPAAPEGDTAALPLGNSILNKGGASAPVQAGNPMAGANNA